MFTFPIPSVPSPKPAASAPTGDRLEQAFLEEMLKYAGPKSSSYAFGETGESQFSVFLTREYAALLSQALDFGLRLQGVAPK